ncbi:galactosylceramide sulfotransferase-like [Liolophura sinensis]|uniref:galactosylceramide sulfotransferase-like n=1 Tax=Liolophura sinensis TaxID=3198878 RepID=UPI0031580B0A
MDRTWYSEAVTTAKHFIRHSTQLLSQKLHPNFVQTLSSSSLVDSVATNHPLDNSDFERKCQAHRHIGFIKVHKAGSSSVTNILYRFGMANNLTFVLPRRDVTVTSMQTSNWRNILPPPRGKQFDILCSHAVYVRAELTKLLPADTFYIAIIRQPFSHLASSIYYYYRSKIPGPGKVKTYLKNPYYYSNVVFNNYLRSFTNNSMSYELGLTQKHVRDKGKIQTFLKAVDADFGLILIMELMDESLVLLRRYLCLEFKDILYIPRNKNNLKPPTGNISASLRQKHVETDMADYMLYDFFSKKLQNRMTAAGKDFMQEVRVFKSVLTQLRQFCSGLHSPEVSQLHVTSNPWSRSFNISLDDCKLYLFNGIEILNYVKHYQYPDRF